MRSTPRSQNLALAALVAAVVIVTLDTTILNVAIPTIRSELHTSFQSLQWVIAGYSLTLGSLLVIGGRIGDMIGPRRAFAIGAVVFAGGSLVASQANGVAALVIGEAVIEGIGASLLFPASLATLSSLFTGARRGRAFGAWGGAAGAAAALGPVLGGWLTSDYSWRWGFRINVVVAPVAALVALWALPATTDRRAMPRVDVAGCVLLAGGLFSLVLGITKAPDSGWLTMVPAFVAAAVLLSAFVVVERRQHASALVDLELFRVPTFGRGLATSLTVVMAQAGSLYALAVFLQATHHLTPVTAGRWLLPLGIAVLVGARVGGRSAERIGAIAVVRAGTALATLGVAGLAVALHATVDWAHLSIPLAVFGIGSGLASSQLTSVTLSEVPPPRLGAASGAATTNNALGAALGVALIGTVMRVGDAGSPTATKWALATATALVLLGALTASTLRPRTTAPLGSGPSPTTKTSPIASVRCSPSSR